MTLKMLSVEEFDNLRKSGFTIIDLRPANEFADSFIPGSLGIVPDESFDEISAHFIFKDQAVLIVDHEENYEKDLKFLKKRGFENIGGFLKGGFDEWIVKGKKIDLILSMDGEELSLDLKYGPKQILDIRIAGDFESSSISGSENIDVRELLEEYERFDNKVPVCICCKNGNLSLTLISYLKKNGKHNIFHLTGGFDLISKYPDIQLVSGK